MKRLPFLFTCILAFISTCVFSAYAADLKIGILDTQKIVMQSEKINQYRTEFSKELDAKRQEFLKKQGEAKALQDDLNNNGSSMTSDVLRAKSDKLRIETRDLKRMQEEIEAELKSKEADMTRKFLTELKVLADDYLKKEKFSLILEKGNVVSSDDAIDITDQLMKLYDSK